MKIWHLFRGITFMTIWIEWNDWVFNWEQWHKSKIKHLVWNDLIMYTKAAWERVVKYVFLGKALFPSFDNT